MVHSSGIPTLNRARSRAFAVLAGLIAAGLGLAAAELLSGLLGRQSTPVIAVGDEVIERSPHWLTEWAISTFGTADKTVLLTGIFVVFAVLSAGIGVLASRHRAAGAAAAGVLGLIAAVAVAGRPDSEALDVVIAVVAAGVAVGALLLLVDRAVRASVPVATGEPTELAGVPQAHASGAPAAQSSGAPEEPTGMRAAAGASGSLAGPIQAAGAASGPTPDRRSFVRFAVGGALLASTAGLVGRWVGTRRREVEASREELGEPQALPRELPSVDPPVGADLEVPGGEPWQTPNDVFYRIDTALSAPLVHPDDWQLRVHGMVEQEVVLDFDQLVALGLVDTWVTLCCVSNQVGGDLIGNAFWTGVRTSDVLGMAGPLAGADAVLSTSHDGWTCGTPLDVLTDGRDSLFAVAMNGEPLPVEHGFPVRMVVPGLYGYVSATKWVVDVEVSRFEDFTAYWSSRGWSERGPVKMASRIDVPSRGASVGAGTVPVAGVAWAQHRGIEAVEVRVDGGEWQPAEIAEVPSADTWRQWVWQWDATPGDHSLEVRATASDGEVQTDDVAPPAPDGATGWHRVDVTVES